MRALIARRLSIAGFVLAGLLLVIVPSSPINGSKS
jgi:hypothetical protein